MSVIGDMNNDMDGLIQKCRRDHIERYGEIYAAAFSGEPWNDPWEVEDAVVHVKELLESKQACRMSKM